MVNWEKFASLVPAGCQCRFHSRYSNRMCYGIIEENIPFSYWERWDDARGPFPTSLRFEGFDAPLPHPNRPFWLNPKQASFLIKDTWLTFDEVMALA